MVRRRPASDEWEAPRRRGDRVRSKRGFTAAPRRGCLGGACDRGAVAIRTAENEEPETCRAWNSGRGNPSLTEPPPAGLFLVNGNRPICRPCRLVAKDAANLWAGADRSCPQRFGEKLARVSRSDPATRRALPKPSRGGNRGSNPRRDAAFQGGAPGSRRPDVGFWLCRSRGTGECAARLAGR